MGACLALAQHTRSEDVWRDGYGRKIFEAVALVGAFSQLDGGVVQEGSSQSLRGQPRFAKVHKDALLCNLADNVRADIDTTALVKKAEPV